ncbi:hypothetical protein L9F63_003375, partial [Diploptera punctata]
LPSSNDYCRHDTIRVQYFINNDNIPANLETGKKTSTPRSKQVFLPRIRRILKSNIYIYRTKSIERQYKFLCYRLIMKCWIQVSMLPADNEMLEYPGQTVQVSMLPADNEMLEYPGQYKFLCYRLIMKCWSIQDSTSSMLPTDNAMLEYPGQYK